MNYLSDHRKIFLRRLMAFSFRNNKVQVYNNMYVKIGYGGAVC